MSWDGDAGQGGPHGSQPAQVLVADSGNAGHPGDRGEQDLVLRHVGGEIVIPDLHRDRASVMPAQLIGFPQAAAKHRG